MQTSTMVVTGVATLFALGGAYAFYFDYKRRNDPEFRKALKRDKKRHAKTQKLQAEAAHAEQRQTLIASVRDAQLVGFPTDVEEKEAFFMNEVATGEALCQEGPDKALDAALSFYKALKVYPQPKDLISIYDKTVPKHVLDILAEMIALDGSIAFGGSSVGSGHENPTGVE
ncbi:uncharacterized protein LAJ45_02897 [Morchella importuna]|nr:uncharacterized protein LAJ45_02897 [Morchella importuna]KAH8153310.1 hypothetical protein LAJ45_02897 [Morchella importuna]